MENENKELVLDTNEDYIDALKKMKANSVSKEDYEALKAKNAELLKNFVEGNLVPSENKPKPKTYDKKALREKIFSGKTHGQLECWAAALELREALMAEGQEDPFLPKGSKITPDENDRIKAQRVADYVKNAIEYAEGNNEIFVQELQRGMVDTGPKKRK